MTLFFFIIPKPWLRNYSRLARCPLLPEECFHGPLV